MSAVEVGLVTQLVLALVAAIVALSAPPTLRSALAGVVSAAVGVAGAITGVLVLAGWRGRVDLPTSLPLGDVGLDPSPLGGFFMVVAGTVGAVAAVYAIGYAEGAAASRTSWASWPVFLAAMQLIPAAGDAVSFLLLWELMALASTLLVLTDHRDRAEVRQAALWYAALTQLSFVLLLLGFAVLAVEAGGADFDLMGSLDPGSMSASVAFVLLGAGFATKAGIVPVHVWLPRAHPAAPSHVSAVMSAAMVKMGVYGALLVSLRLLPAGPAWWGLLLLGFGAVSAVYGILQASVTSDLKRLLAYSTTENVGLMFLALGTALLLRSVGVGGPADSAVAACLLLVASHAAFKCTLFLAAGSVLHGSGECDLDQMGGLGSRMPVTALAFGVGALGAAALPVTAGFMAEWALLQSLIHGARPEDRLVAVAMPVAVAVVALTAGLGLLTFVKAYGIAFLARPRSDGAAAAHESGAWTMRPAMLVSAAAVLALGLVPGLAAEAVTRAGGIGGVGRVGPAGLELSGVGAQLDPVALSVMAPAPGRAGPVRLARGGTATAPTSGGAGVGLRGSPGQPPHAVHRDLLRRAVGPGLRRRATTRTGHRGHPHQRVEVPRRARGVPPAARRRRGGTVLPTHRPARRPSRPGGPSPAERQHPPLPGLLVRRARRRPRAGGPVNAEAGVLAVAQVVAMVALSPLLVGVMRQVRARLEGRVGAGVLQPWRDLRKLLGKEPLQAAGTSWVSVAGPTVLIVSSLLVCAMTPLLGTLTFTSVPDDLFVVVSVLLIGTVAVALVGLDAGTAFGGMGSSRHMTIAALVEPTVLVSVYALSIPVGSSVLSQIVEARLDDPASVASPVSLLALLALAVAVVAETGRLPVDNPSTHLELTMVHEAMVLESSGRDLAWLELGSWLRLGALLGLLSTLLVPWGIATELSAGGLLLASGALVAKLAITGALLAAVEVFLAKLRLFRIPELLAGSFVLAFLAVTASYLVVQA